MQTYTITCDQNRIKGVDFNVHKCGCRDIEREMTTSRQRSCRSWNVEAESAAEAVAAEVKSLDEQDMGYTADDFNICPCCKGK